MYVQFLSDVTANCFRVMQNVNTVREFLVEQALQTGYTKSELISMALILMVRHKAMAGPEMAEKFPLWEICNGLERYT